MPSHHSNKRVVFLSCFILGVFAFLWPLQAGSAENGERTPTFSAGAAITGLKLDALVPIASTVSTAPRFSFSDVHLLGKKLSRNSQMPELEPVETYGSFFGLKITLQLKGGWNVFSGGDIEKAIGGMYDNAVNLISATGAPIVQNQKKSNHAGLEAGGDIIYCVTPRFGIGIGTSRIQAGKESVLLYEVISTTYESLRTRPKINVTVLRLGLFYAFPFAGRLAISIHGGPALYSAEYSYNMAVTTGSYGLDIIQRGFLLTGLYQEARAKQMGLEGGVGFEFNANPFVAFFVEALGRYARISGFEGEEEATLYQDFHRQVFNQAGSLYYVARDQYPLLDIIPPEGTAGGNARKATLDFSGFSFSAGLKLRF
ncbi:MAG: hypothetical protein WAU81_15050 [Candidatus Aminicenantales bacterium]